MNGVELLLKHQILEAQHRELRAEVERRRAIDLALAPSGARRSPVSGMRATIAELLLRAGSWLMPDPAPESYAQLDRRTLALRPGQ